MLILVPRHVVAAVHVSPVNLGGEEVNRDKIPGGGGVLDGALSEGSFGNTAALNLIEEGAILVVASFELRLRERVNGLIVVGVVLLLFSCDVLHTLSPGIFRDSPVTILLDADVVNTTDNSEEAVLSPVGAP